MAVEFEGVGNVVERIATLADLPKIKGAVGRACALVEREAKMKAPTGRTGDLAKFTQYKVEMVGGNVRGVVFNPLEYAPYVEYGTGLFAEDGNGRQDVPWHYQDDKGDWHTTSGQPPQPFLRPALNENRERIKRIIKEGISND